MDWGGVPAAIILLISAVALISLLFWFGHAVLNFLGDDMPIGLDRKPLLESRERLATQEDREEVDEIAGGPDRLAAHELGKPSL